MLETVFIVILAIPALWGLADLYIAWRFLRDAENADKTAFFFNWIAFKWAWTNQSKAIVEKLPFFQKDLTETFGIREDDGRVT